MSTEIEKWLDATIKHGIVERMENLQEEVERLRIIGDNWCDSYKLLQAENAALSKQLAETQYEALQRAIQFDKDVAYLQRKLERVREWRKNQWMKDCTDRPNWEELDEILDRAGKEGE